VQAADERHFDIQSEPISSESPSGQGGPRALACDSPGIPTVGEPNAPCGSSPPTLDPRLRRVLARMASRLLIAHDGAAPDLRPPSGSDGGVAP
jgi:hypothetical protein